MAYYFTSADYQKLIDNNVDLFLNDVKVTGAFQLPSNSKLEFASNSGAFFNITGGGYPDRTSVNFYYYDGNTGDDGYLKASVLLDNNTKAIFNNFDRWNYGIINFNLEVEALIQSPYYVITESDIARLEGNGTKLYRDGIELLLNDEIYSNDLIVAKANAGYTFNLDFNLEPEIYFLAYDPATGDSYHYRFALNEERNSGSLIINDNWNGSYNKTGFFSYTSQADDVKGSNSVYLVDSDKLSEINSKRFASDGKGGSYDYGQFILGVVQLPFNIPDEYIQDVQDVYLANVNTGVKATKISNDLIEIDLGSIEVPLINGNLLDFSNTTALLHLPRVPPINISLEYVIGETISIKYLVSLYDGLTTVNIISSKTDEAINTISVNLGFNIPYANVPKQSIDNSNIVIGGDNGVNTAFIEIIRNNSILSNGVFTIPIVDEKTLFDEKGYVEVSKIELEGRIKLSDRQKIINLLSNGVIIK